MLSCNKRRVQNTFMCASLSLYLICITGYLLISCFPKNQESTEKRIMQRINLHAASDNGLVFLDSEKSKSEHIFTGEPFRKLPEIAIYTNRKAVKAVGQFKCNNWAVVTTVSRPMDSVRLITSDNKWCIVIVADKNSPSKGTYISELGYSGERLAFLEPEDQENFFPDLSTAISWNHLGRKNIGYIFAVQNGAELIWDFDDHNQGLFDISIIHSQQTMRVLKRCKGSYKLFNPYPYFGVNESYIWPRGFPLQFVHETDALPGLCTTDISVNKVGVIQSIANIEPDVDAIFRLIRPRSLMFEATKYFPLISVPRFSYCPFNAHATLWTKSSFLYMALPTSVHSRVSDIWRSYIAQYFFHKNKTNLLFSPPYVIQNYSQNLVGDFDAEIDMQQKAYKLVNFLHTFRPKLNTTLEDMYGELYKRGYIELRDINFIQLWTKTYLVASGSK